jgi:ABC-type Fe3+-hydroxamate transport system substrate-binding protein
LYQCRRPALFSNTTGAGNTATASFALTSNRTSGNNTADGFSALLTTKPIIQIPRNLGLIAEEVAEVNPDLVVRDEKGEIYTVRCDAVNAMLLNEFVKEHRAFIEEQRKVAKFEATITRQQQEMEALTAAIKEQAAQIQKVSAELATSRPSWRTRGEQTCTENRLE